MNEYSLSKRGSDLCLDFNRYDYWEALEELLEILKRNYQVKMIDEIEGPDSRVVRLDINNELFSLQYDSYGSFLKSPSRDSDALLLEIKNYFESL